MWNRILKRKPNKKEKIITAAVIAALAGTMAAALVYISHKDVVSVREPVFISYMGEAYEFEGKTTLRWDKKQNLMYLENRSLDSSLPMMGMPVYSENRDSLIVTSMMSYTNPDTNYIRRLSYFGKAAWSGQNCTLSVKGSRNTIVNGGYLFDGTNTWVFLEPVTVTIGDEEISLEPLSYIYVKNKEYLYYYSSGENKSVFEEWTGADIMADNSNGKWSLNLSRDLLVPEDGRIQMLIPNPEILDVVQ